MSKTLQEVELEPSTHTHTLKAPKVTKEEVEEGVMKVDIEGEGVVQHGEHGSMNVDGGRSFKFPQFENDPIQQVMRPTYD